MVDFASFLNRKYEILAQQADAASLQAKGNYLMDTTRAGLLPKEAAASIARMNADTNYRNKEVGAFDQVTAADINYKNSAAFNQRTGGQLNQAQARSVWTDTNYNYGAVGAPTQIGMPSGGPGLIKVSDIPSSRERQGGFSSSRTLFGNDRMGIYRGIP